MIWAWHVARISVAVLYYEPGTDTVLQDWHLSNMRISDGAVSRLIAKSRDRQSAATLPSSYGRLAPYT
jgi:hypothetical protein